jgi:glycosyltransferase involved in cell wall biosynthesis
VIAAYNAESWIDEAVRSVLSQTMPDFELIVVDDASTDRTAELVAAESDGRLQLSRNLRNRGQSGNWNHAVSLSRAPFIKFLCADDFLRADCLEQMLQVAERSPSVGLVFSRRDIAVSSSDEPGAAWREKYARVHEHFGPLDEVNSGRKMFDAFAGAEFPDNWVGEPTNVMLRREAFDRLGGFHSEIRQPVDLELWTRAIFHFDVGFIDDTLATYRVLPDSVTRVTASEGSRWLDRLWFLESLLADEEIRRAHPELTNMARRERLHAAGSLAKGLRNGLPNRQRLQEARRYVRYKFTGSPDKVERSRGQQPSAAGS